MSSDEISRPTLGVVAICRNEEVDLPGFLENFLPWIDEVVLVDEFSDDRTVEIAQTAGRKVRLLQRRRDGETGFAGQRNAGIDVAESDWLLHVDIDNRVPPDLAREILVAIRASNRNAYRYRRLNFFLHRPMRGGGLQRWNQPWLARREKGRFKNTVHEECVVEGAPHTVGQLRAPMWHLNDDSYTERLRKSMQYCQLEAEKLLRSKRQVRLIDFLWQPFKLVARRILFDNALRDGMLGVIFTFHSADAVFRAYALAWDAQHQIPRATLEEEIRAAWVREPMS